MSNKKTETHFTAEFFYKQFKTDNIAANRQQFYRLVDAHNIEFISLFRGPRLYSVKDWNEKTPERYRVEIPEE
jgi:hypothetical protein